MTFAVRGIVVMLAFFGLLYCILSALTVGAWRIARGLRRNGALDSPRLLFALRIFPLAGSALLTLSLALPAFLLLEPAAIDEDSRTLLLAVVALSLLGVGLFRVLVARAGASRLVAIWQEAAQNVSPGGPALSLPAKPGVPPLLLYGISEPKVLVSHAAVAVLNPDEMTVAVRHELCHMRARDNLKKLILHGVSFPGMASLDRAWRTAAEFAADRAAVTSPVEALDLASALIKLSRLAPFPHAPAFTSGIVNVECLAKLRIERLVNWSGHAPGPAFLPWRFFLFSSFLFLPYALTYYGQALQLTHRFTERFIH